MRIACVISSLGPGGGERVLCTAANWWARTGETVRLLVLSEAVEPAFAPDASVQVQFLGKQGVSGSLMGAVGANIGRVRTLRRAVQDFSPEVVVGFMDTTNVLTLLACLGTGVRVVATEHTVPTHHNIGVFWETLRRLTYPHADAVIVQTEEARQYFPQSIAGRISVLPNPVALSFGDGISREKEGKTIVAMGRLSREKGFDLLLEAFAELAPLYPEWTLVILGEGPLRKELEEQRNGLGLDGRVAMPGFSATPHDWFIRADVFVLSSRFEGFGNALVEAMMCGLPVISADCPWGPASIVRDGENGLLVDSEDVPALAQGMRRLMEDDILRKELGTRAKESASCYGVSNAMAEWDEVVLGRGAVE